MARLKRRLQVKKLAKRLGVDPCTVSNWEKKGFRPDHLRIRKLKEEFPELACVPQSIIYSDYPFAPKTIGERLKKKRLELDMGQTEFAQKLGVCVDAVADWESGRTRSQDTHLEAKVIQQLQG